MIKVDIKTLVATREPIPEALIGLEDSTLLNLQTELNPVPAEFKDIEFWNEVDVTPYFDSATSVLDGTEVLKAVKASKTVEITKGVRFKTQVELDAEHKALVPISITKLQAMKAMKQAGIWAAFNTALGSNQDALDEWVLALDLHRDNAFVAILAPTLGLTDIQIDDLFILGATL